jgi:hypothetical protein
MSPASGHLVGLDGFTFTIQDFQVLLIGDPQHSAVLGVRLCRLLGLLAGRVSREKALVGVPLGEALVGVPFGEVIRVTTME